MGEALGIVKRNQGSELSCKVREGFSEAVPFHVGELWKSRTWPDASLSPVPSLPLPLNTLFGCKFGSFSFCCTNFRSCS